MQENVLTKCLLFNYKLWLKAVFSSLWSLSIQTFTSYLSLLNKTEMSPVWCFDCCAIKRMNIRYRISPCDLKAVEMPGSGSVCVPTHVGA